MSINLDVEGYYLELHPENMYDKNTIEFTLLVPDMYSNQAALTIDDLEVMGAVTDYYKKYYNESY